MDHNVAAVHHPPAWARKLIRDGATRALGKIDQVERFWIDPPYEMVRVTRQDEEGIARRAVKRGDDFVDLMNTPGEYVPV